MNTSFNEVRELLELRWEQLGFDNLLQVERDYILVWGLQAEASNGTLHQYFYNSSGDHAPETLAALQRLGANSAHAVFEKAVEAFGPSHYPTDRDERIELLKSIPNDEEIFERLTDELFEQSEDVVSLAIDRIGSAYVEKGIEAKDYASASKLRLPAIAILVLLLVATVVFTVLMIAVS